MGRLGVKREKAALEDTLGTKPDICFSSLVLPDSPPSPPGSALQEFPSIWKARAWVFISLTYQTALSWFWEYTLMDIICVDFVVQIKLSNTLTNIWWYFGRLRCPEKLETKTLEALLWCTFVLVHHAEDLCINNLWIYSKPTWHQKCTQRSIFSNVFLLVDIFRAELRECFEMGLPFPKVVVRACRDFANFLHSPPFNYDMTRITTNNFAIFLTLFVGISDFALHLYG